MALCAEGTVLRRNLVRAACLIQSDTAALPSPKIKINRKVSVSVHVGGVTWILSFHGGCTPMRSGKSHCPALCLISLIVKHDLLHLFPQVLWLLMENVNHCFTVALAGKSGPSFSLCVLCSSHTGRIEPWRNWRVQLLGGGFAVAPKNPLAALVGSGCVCKHSQALSFGLLLGARFSFDIKQDVCVH